MATIADYQTDNLILLVGTNPLPNYVAGKVLCKSDGSTRIHLVITEGIQMAKIHEYLAVVLGLPSDWQSFCLVVRSDDPVDVYKKIDQRINDHKGSWGLNYTGGTKLMSVHARRAMGDKFANNAVYSYLDAKSLSMVFEPKAGQTAPTKYSIGREVKLSIEQVLKLHGYDLQQPRKLNQGDNLPYDTQPFEIDLSNEMLMLMLSTDKQRDWSQWVKCNLKDPKGKFKNNTELSKVQLPDLLPDAMHGKMLGDFVTNRGGDISKWRHWLAGIWLEEIVLEAVTKCVQQVDSFGKSIKPIKIGKSIKDNDFEIDIVVMRGYRLFAISVTTDNEDSMCKLKLFEAVERARQMGGDEARVALVCLSTEWQKLQNMVHQLLPSDMVRVFGAPHLQDIESFAVTLSEWFEA